MIIEYKPFSNEIHSIEEDLKRVRRLIKAVKILKAVEEFLYNKFGKEIFYCEKCGKIYTINELMPCESEVKTYKSNVFVCPFCKTELKREIVGYETVWVEKWYPFGTEKEDVKVPLYKYTCPKCGWTFDEREKHGPIFGEPVPEMKEVIEKVIDYKCPKCGKTLYSTFYSEKEVQPGYVNIFNIYWELRELIKTIATKVIYSEEVRKWTEKDKYINDYVKELEESISKL